MLKLLSLHPKISAQVRLHEILNNQLKLDQVCSWKISSCYLNQVWSRKSTRFRSGLIHKINSVQVLMGSNILLLSTRSNKVFQWKAYTAKSKLCSENKRRKVKSTMRKQFAKSLSDAIAGCWFWDARDFIRTPTKINRQTERIPMADAAQRRQCWGFKFISNLQTKRRTSAPNPLPLFMQISKVFTVRVLPVHFFNWTN